MSARAGVAAVALLACGCGRLGFDPHAAGGDGPTTDGPSADGASADAPATDAALAPACAGSPLFVDTFDDGQPGPTFVATPDTGLALGELDGELQITYAASVAGNNYAHYRTASPYAATELCIATAVEAIPADPDAGVYLKCRNASQEIEFFRFATFLDLRTRQGGTPTTHLRLDWDPVAHRHWRLRLAGGQGSWDTSDDGVSFVERHVVPFSVGSCDIELGAGALATVTSADVAAFAGVEARGP